MEEESKEVSKINQSFLIDVFLIDVDVSIKNEWLIFISRYNGRKLTSLNVLKDREAKDFYSLLVSTEAKRKENINDQFSTRQING